MKIQRTTKVQQGSNILSTSIPSVITEIIGIQKGTELEWTLENENEVKIRKKED